MNAQTTPQTTPCPGEGRKWQSGMGRATCPVCHRSAVALGACTIAAPRQWHVMKGKTVPAHTVR